VPGAADDKDAPTDPIAETMTQWLYFGTQNPRAGAALLITGAPGDGAESLFERLRLLVTGPAFVAPLVPRASRPLPRRPDDPNRLPAVALLLPDDDPATVPVLPLLPERAEDAIALLSHLTGPPVMLVGRYLRVPASERPENVFIVNLVDVPFVCRAAVARLTKPDPRMWLAVEHRNPRLTRRAETWSARLRAPNPGWTAASTRW
jgi:hypothetical protein